MKSFKFLGALVMGAALAASGVGVAGAAPSDKGVSSYSVSQKQAKAASDYWTPARMKAATPRDVTVDKKGQKVTAGKKKPTPTILATRQAPVKHIGKVFFTLGGRNYVCSGNAVVSTNESTVATAGHCLNSGPGAYATLFTFVPAYENGAAPYGKWPATQLFAPSQWTANGDITYDTGFAKVSSPTGVSLSDTVGASPVVFNQARGLSYTAFGYPAASPFNGELLYSCTGRATADPYGQSQSQGIPCDMTGGSSGGPWFIGTGSGGAQNSVNSFGYNNVPNTMFGPYWGTVIQNAYLAAAAA